MKRKQAHGTGDELAFYMVFFKGHAQHKHNKTFKFILNTCDQSQKPTQYIMLKY